MEKIRFASRLEISAGSDSPWELAIHETSWFETRLQLQNFPGFSPEIPFLDLLKNFPGSDAIHSRVSPSITGFIRSLSGKFPDLSDAFGEKLTLEQFRFLILDSDFSQKEKHRVELTFYSPQLLLLRESVSGFLVADLSEEDRYLAGEEIPTRLIPMQPGLSVSHYQKS